MADYIRAEMQEGRLSEWTVLLASGEGDEKEAVGHRFQQVQRAWHGRLLASPEEKEFQISRGHFRIRRLVSPTDEAIDLDDSERGHGHRKFKHPTRCTSNSALLQSEPLVHRFRTHRPLPHAVHAVGSGERMYQSQRCEVRHGELRSRIIPGVEIAV